MLDPASRWTQASASVNRRTFLKHAALGVAGMAAGAGVSVTRAQTSGAPSAPVAIRRCPRYDVDEIRAALSNLLHGLETDTQLAGRKVVIKTNLVISNAVAFSRPNVYFHDTHWAVVLGAALVFQEMGASQIKLVESINEAPAGVTARAAFDYANYPTQTLIDAAGISFENTRNRGSYPDYVERPVPGGSGYLFDFFRLNPAWNDPDTFYVSMPKLKIHGTAGITLGLKNLMGMPPNSWYGNRSNPSAYEEWNNKARTAIHNGSYQLPGERDPAIHGHTEVGGRLPRTIVDLNQCRPMDLTIVDGIMGQTSHMRPDNTTQVVGPGVLIAGSNTVCTDAVSTAVMGHDPEAAGYAMPFYNGENQLALAAAKGLGTNKLSEIPIIGEAIKNVRTFYLPKKRT